MKPLSWKPRASGEVYCSPACGHDCTRGQWIRAKKRAEQIAKDLGKGWKPSVWENMGWHSQACKGTLRVSRSDYGFTSYYAQTDGRGILGEGRSPKAALKCMQIRLQSEVDAASDLLYDALIG